VPPPSLKTWLLDVAAKQLQRGPHESFRAWAKRLKPEAEAVGITTTAASIERTIRQLRREGDDIG
jgi:hypothetical protein